jgi:hypothetical protein
MLATFDCRRWTRSTQVQFWRVWDKTERLGQNPTAMPFFLLCFCLLGKPMAQRHKSNQAFVFVTHFIWELGNCSPGYHQVRGKKNSELIKALHSKDGGIRLQRQRANVCHRVCPKRKEERTGGGRKLGHGFDLKMPSRCHKMQQLEQHHHKLLSHPTKLICPTPPS